jgi:hypothetical protein
VWAVIVAGRLLAVIRVWAVIGSVAFAGVPTRRSLTRNVVDKPVDKVWKITGGEAIGTPGAGCTLRSTTHFAELPSLVWNDKNGRTMATPAAEARKCRNEWGHVWQCRFDAGCGKSACRLAIMGGVTDEVCGLVTAIHASVASPSSQWVDHQRFWLGKHDGAGQWESHP